MERSVNSPFLPRWDQEGGGGDGERGRLLVRVKRIRGLFSAACKTGRARVVTSGATREMAGKRVNREADVTDVRRVREIGESARRASDRRAIGDAETRGVVARYRANAFTANGDEKKLTNLPRWRTN